MSHRTAILAAILAFIGLRAEAGPINNYPAANTPLSGSEQMIGTQNNHTVQISAHNISTYTLGSLSSNNVTGALGYVPARSGANSDITSLSGLTGLTLPGATSGGATFVITPGTAPGSPANGAIWPTGSGFYVRIGGVTYNLLSGGSSGVTSWNTRTGAVTLQASDVFTALTYTPLNPANNLSDVSSAATALSNLGGLPINNPTATGTLTTPGLDVTMSIVAPQFNSSTAGLVPASGGGTTNFLRADGAFAAPAGGGGGTVTSVTCGTGLTGGTFTTSGTCALSSPVSVANGGTSASSASGTALDNITGWTSTGFIQRTGAGSYSFNSVPTISGAITTGHCASWASGTSLQDSGSTCGGGGGSGTVTSIIAGTGLSGGTITTSGTIALASVAANSALVNNTAVSGIPTAVALPSCSGGNNALAYNTSSGVFSCNTISSSGSPGGSNTNVQYNSSGSFAGNTGLTYDGVSVLGVGQTGSSGGSVSLKGAVSGSISLITPSSALGSSTATLPVNSGVLAETNLAQNWTAAQTFNNSDIVMNGSSTGATTFTSANASGTNYTITFPAASGTVSLTSSGVTSVTNSDGTLTTSPTTGAVVVSLNLGQANVWTNAQTFTNTDLVLKGSSTGTTAFSSANASATSYTATVPANTGTIGELNLAQTFTAAQTFTNSDFLLLGSSTGATTLTSANGSATNYTATLPAATDTIAELAATQTLTNKTISGSSNTLSAIALASLASEAANTVVGNATAGSASPTALAVPSCSGASNALTYTSASGFGCNTISGGGGGSGLTDQFDITSATYGCVKSTSTSSTDQGSCIQAAINAANTAGGGIVWAPSGFWNLKSQIVVKPNVTLQCVGNGNVYDSNSVAYGTTQGAIFAVLWGSGSGSSNTASDAAIQINHGGAVKDCGFWYPSQNPLTPIATGPTEYGSTLLAYDTVIGNVHQTATGNWCANCYNFVDFRGTLAGYGVTAAFISNNIGSPIHYGVALNYQIDWGTMHDDHFNSGALDQSDTSGSYTKGWIQANGVAFYIGQSDWVTLLNEQAWGYNSGVLADFATTVGPGIFGPVTLQNDQFDSMQADVYLTGQIQNLRILGSTFTAFNTYTGAKGYVVSGVTGVNLASLQMDGDYVFGPTDDVLQLGGSGWTLGNISITNVHASVSTVSQYAYNLGGTVKSLYIAGSTYTGFTPGLYNTGATYTNTPVTAGNWQ